MVSWSRGRGVNDKGVLYADTTGRAAVLRWWWWEGWRMKMRFAFERSRHLYAHAAHGPEYAKPAWGEMTTREPETGILPIPGTSSGTCDNHWSSCVARVEAEAEYHEPAWEASRTDILRGRNERCDGYPECLAHASRSYRHWVEFEGVIEQNEVVSKHRGIGGAR